MSSSESECEDNNINDAPQWKDDKDEEEVDEEVYKLTDNKDSDKTFASLGLLDVLVQSCEEVGWKKPSKIQEEAIPLAVQGKDVIGLAETGSGKTGAFALPILHHLLENPQKVFACILTPTRELAFQISEQFEALGARIKVTCCVIVGGVDMVSQAIMLAKKPHIIVATPGRLVDHLENTKGFNMKQLKFLVMDEADRILNLDFEKEVTQILRCLPSDRKTMLFSATMTKKVNKLQRACLKDPVKVEVSSKFKTVDKLHESYLFIPLKYKEMYLVKILTDLAGNTFIIFCSTCRGTLQLSLMLRCLGFTAIPLNGQMSQNTRLASLTKFKAKNRNILIATDVASRGLDIPHIDVVINFDIPMHSKDYIHRVGRTARAGKSGRAVTFVSQYDVELYQRIEHLLGKQLPLYPTDEKEVLLLTTRVGEATRLAQVEYKEMEDKRKSNKKRKKGGQGGDDAADSLGIIDRLGGAAKGKKGQVGGGGRNNGAKKFKKR